MTEEKDDLELGAHTTNMLATLDDVEDGVLDLPDTLTDKQREIVKLRMRGLTQRAIAKVLDISQPAVAKQFKSIRDKLEASGRSINQDLVVGESVLLFQDIEHRGWELYHLAKSKEKIGDANKALQLVLAAREKTLNVLMDLGLVKRAAIEHEHSVVSPLIERWQKGEAQQRMVITKIIETTLEPLEEPTPPALVEDVEDAEIVEND